MTFAQGDPEAAAGNSVYRRSSQQGETAWTLLKSRHRARSWPLVSQRWDPKPLCVPPALCVARLLLQPSSLLAARPLGNNGAVAAGTERWRGQRLSPGSGAQHQAKECHSSLSPRKRPEELCLPGSPDGEKREAEARAGNRLPLPGEGLWHWSSVTPWPGSSL